MSRHIIRRLIQAVPLLILISIILFLLVNNMADPVASFAGGRRRIRPEDYQRIAHQLGLDQPLPVQYVIWLVGNDWMHVDMDGDGIADESGPRRGVLRGDLGNSFMERRPAADVIVERIPATLLLMGSCEVVVIIFSLFIGIYSALRQYSISDHVITGLAFVGYSMPIFWLSLMLMYVFAVNFRNWGLPYLPSTGMYDLSVGPTPAQVAWHLVLPVASMSIVSVAGYSRYVRSQMLEVISQDYVRTAHAKGLPQRLVVMRHALKNAALPFVTIVGMDIPLLVGGATVTETIFAWPGMGRLFYEAASDADVPVLMGLLLILSALVVIFQIITDVTYTFLDPRIRYD
jgi:peptide/nickel transport system permease protein